VGWGGENSSSKAFGISFADRPKAKSENSGKLVKRTGKRILERTCLKDETEKRRETKTKKNETKPTLQEAFPEAFQ
jgi:hypothetical protein